jgi:hypothetical protein
MDLKKQSHASVPLRRDLEKCFLLLLVLVDELSNERGPVLVTARVPKTLSHQYQFFLHLQHDKEPHNDVDRIQCPNL